MRLHHGLVSAAWACAVLVLACQSDTTVPLPRATAESIGFPVAPSGSVQSITANPLLLRNAVIIDGTGAPPIPGQDILIRDGKIAEIGPGIELNGVTVLDVSGQTVLPGLIDGHTHTQSVPGSELRGDSVDLIQAQQLLQFRAYLASGVTTVLDTGISKPTLLRFRTHLDEAGIGPALFHLSPFLTPSGGYFGTDGLRGSLFSDVWEPVVTDDMIGRQLREAVPLRPTGVKVTVESGMVFPIWPLFSDEQLAVIKREAKAVDTRVFVHSMKNDAHRIALQLDPYAFVHVGLGDAAIAPDVLDAIKNSGAYVISTLSAYKLETWFWDQSTMLQPWIEARVPKVQWATALHPDMKSRSLDLMTPVVKHSWMPGWLARAVAPLMRSASMGQRELASSQRAVLAMYKAGIPLVMGADEGNWPLFTTFFHGVGSLLEMQLLEEAGLPRDEVIVMATSRAARMLGQEDRIGSVKAGLEADLIVVPKNPLEHGMKVLPEVSWVVKHGVARTPQAWLHAE